MIEDMQLRGLSPGTQKVYVGAVQALAVYYRKSPDQLSDEELRQYFVYLTNERRLARSRMVQKLIHARNPPCK